MNKKFFTKNVSLFCWSVRLRREGYNLFTIGSKWERFNQSSTEFTFLNNTAATLQCYAKKVMISSLFKL